jgi:hypothetical protein
MNPYQPYETPKDDDQQPQPHHWFAELLMNPTFGAFMAATLAGIIVLAGALGMVLLW